MSDPRPRRTRIASYRAIAICVLIVAIVVFRIDSARTIAAPIVTPIDLGTLGGANSYATAINSSGQVAGASQVSDGHYHAFIWSAATGMVDIGTLAGADTTPTAMNNSGQVIGAAGDQAFSWTAADGIVTLGPIGVSFAFNVPPPRAVTNDGHVGANNVATC